MAKYLFLCITLLFSFHSALAGDHASREIIGFSKDGDLFAFEEYGIQDGSGFPYSNIYVVDTKTDQWTNGSPWRARIEDEYATIAAARTKARSMVETTLDQITEKGFIAATNRHTEVQSDPTKFAASPRSYVPSTNFHLEYSLKIHTANGPDYCQDFGGSKGFELSQTFPRQEKASRILHKDSNILPKSRQCALDYKFADIVTYYPEDNGITAPAVAAILILYETVGFEGPDGRYLAVTAPIE